VTTLSASAELVLERVSMIVERYPDLPARSIWVRAKLAKKSGEAALDWLRRNGFVERRRHDQEWRYSSLRAYRMERTHGAAS
jgi:hypothetical protein